MAGFRAYFNFTKIPNPSQIELSEDESRHLCGSLRAREGDAVDVFDLSGNIFRCKIAKANHKRAVLDIQQKLPTPQRQCDIYLLQCLPKGKTFDEIIRQSVELSIAGIYPIISQFCQVKLSADDALKKRQKWQMQIVEAVKQSSNFSGFEIFTPTSFDNVFANLPNFDLKIVASLQSNAVKISKAFNQMQSLPKTVAVLIGPEGDLSPKEYAIAQEKGFLPITLGNNVLKSETAAICALSQVIAGLDFISQKS